MKSWECHNIILMPPPLDNLYQSAESIQNLVSSKATKFDCFLLGKNESVFSPRNMDILELDKHTHIK